MKNGNKCSIVYQNNIIGTSETEVTIEALDSITHTPAVIIRKIK